MAVSHRASAASGSANPTTSFTITIPSTVQTGDLLIVAATSRDHASGTASPTCTDNDTGGNTWTVLTNTADKKSWIWWKRATSASASKTVTVAGCVGSSSGGISAYSGVLLSGTPYTGLVTETNASADETHASFTNTETNAVILFNVANYANDNAVTSVSGATAGAFTQRFEKLSTGGLDCANALWERTTSSNTGAITWAQTDGTTYSHAFKLVPEPESALTLAAFRFYNDDGSESAATAIEDQNTNVIAAIPSGNYSFHLRLRLQETAGVSGLSTDDFTLEYRRNGGAWTAIFSGSGSFVQSFDSTHLTDGSATTSRLTGGSGSFVPGEVDEIAFADNIQITASNHTELLYTGRIIGADCADQDLIEFRVTKNSAVPLNVYTYYPAIRVAKVVLTQAAFRFYEDGTESGSTAIAAQDANITRDAAETDSVVLLRIRIQETGGISGVATDDYLLQYKVNTNAWQLVGSINQGVVEVESYQSGNLTDGAATTNRLGAGSGSFVAGKIDMSNPLDDLQITASNYTELLYSIILNSFYLVNGDVIQFRVLRNSIELKTYSVTPQITVGAGAAADTDSMFFALM